MLAIDHVNVGPYIRNTLLADKCETREEALMDIYRVMRPGEPPTVDAADALFRRLFFDPNVMTSRAVGRVKMNARLDLKTDDQFAPCVKKTFMAICAYLVQSERWSR
jgi:DNA-directed RNA polymerase subunit beta